MNVADLIEAMEGLAPPGFAEPWDNVGLLVGSRSWPAEHALLTIDMTDAVVQEAIDSSADVVVAYHPPLFKAVKSLTDDSLAQRVALEAAAANIAIYSPHTALDAAPDGVNDWLASAVGEGDVRSLQPHGLLPATEQCKILTFCPEDAVDRIRNGLASIGAGRIGDYEQCSFQLRGRGTFLGGEGTDPAVGRAGRLETADEVRLEMVCPIDSLPLAVVTLQQLHPYEEPPVEIYDLRPRPMRSVGPGRRVVLDRKVDLKTLIERIKSVLGVRQLRVAVARSAPRRYRTIGLCAGAGGSLLDDAVAQGCELFLTGEMRHHDVLAAEARGCTVVLAGHTNTERGYLKRLRQRLIHALPDLHVSISRKDGDPLRVM